MMKRLLMLAAVAGGLAMFGANQEVQAGHGCGYGGGYAYSPTAYAYAAPTYSYAPVYRQAYAQPAYYNTGLSIGFGHNHYGGHRSYYGGRGQYRGNGHYGGHGHFGGHGHGGHGHH